MGEERVNLAFRRLIEKHRSGAPPLAVTVPRKPADAGIDPYLLLIDLERFDNIEKVKIES